MPRPLDLLRDPLVAFVLGGAVLFLVGSRLRPTEDLRTVQVDESIRASLSTAHRTKTGRPPSAPELDSLVQRWLDEELLVREARALGLDRGDPVLRRRLIEKMRLVAAAGIEPPGDAALERFVAAHPERFLVPERVDVEQVFVRGSDAGAHKRAAQLLERLRSGADSAPLGDPAIGGRRWFGRTKDALVGALGDDAARAILSAEPGVWSGPARSASGLHLFRVTGRTEAGTPPLASHRSRVEASWQEEAREREERRLIETLRARYRVEREP